MTKVNKDPEVSRMPRESEQRDHNERQLQGRPDLRFINKGPLWFDPNDVPDGVQWGWVVSKIRHEPQEVSFSLAKQKGWRPIPALKYPQLSHLLWSLDKTEASSIIEVGGQVLCERPIEFKEAEDEMQAEASHAQSSQVNEFVRGNGLNFEESKKYSNKSNDFGN